MYTCIQSIVTKLQSYSQKSKLAKILEYIATKINNNLPSDITSPIFKF